MRRIIILAALAVFSVAACNRDVDTDIEALYQRIRDLETNYSKVNENVVALEEIVEAMQHNAEVVSFSKILDAGKVVGYTVTFREEGKPEQTVTVYDSLVNVSVGELDGKYYWMVGGNWLTDDSGNKIEACKGAVVPEFRITNGVIEVSLDDGISWKAVGEVGQPVVDNVIDSEDEVTFVLAGGTNITLKKYRELSLALSTTSLTMAAGGGRSVTYTINGGSADASVIVYAKDGWKASVVATDATKGYIQVDSPSEASQSQVLVFVSDSGRSVVASISVVSTK